jgi:D-alanyl-D-alanine carboxypeptidase/D-alanyl-D-alanine-endopeptidase (penicillin-binding protein 4)
VLAEHSSLPLAEAIRLINKESPNLQAEMLLRLLGRQMTPPNSESIPEPLLRPTEPPPRRADGSAEAGLAVLRAWLANAGLNPDHVVLQDGSGLSRRNLVTPHVVVELLEHIEIEPWRALYVDSLPVSGVDGTLRERMRNVVLQGRVRAKTGALGATNALAGQLETRAGEKLLFALFVNHHTLPNRHSVDLIDQICEVLVDLPAAKIETRKSKIENR